MREKAERDFIEFLMEDDEKFYEHYLSQLTEEEYQRFSAENEEFGCGKCLKKDMVLKNEIE